MCDMSLHLKFAQVVEILLYINCTKHLATWQTFNLGELIIITMQSNDYYCYNVYTWHDFICQGHTLVLKLFLSMILMQLANKIKMHQSKSYMCDILKLYKNLFCN